MTIDKQQLRAPEPDDKLEVVVPDGWKLVPIEPTLAMVIAGEDAWDAQLDKRLSAKENKEEFATYPSEETHELCSRVAYRAMLSASPALEEVPEPSESDIYRWFQESTIVHHIEEDGSHISKRFMFVAKKACEFTYAKLSASFPNLRSVVPEKKPIPDLLFASYHEAKGWNACIDAMLSASVTPSHSQQREEAGVSVLVEALEDISTTWHRASTSREKFLQTRAINALAAYRKGVEP